MAKITQFLLFGAYMSALLIGWTLIIEIFELVIGMEINQTTAVNYYLAEYIYPALYALSLMPIVGMMVDVIIAAGIFEFFFFIMQMIFRFLQFAQVTGASPIDR